MADKVTFTTKRTKAKVLQSNSNKAFSQRPRKKIQGDSLKKANTKEIPQAITYVLMKEKFEQIYKHIEKISLKDELMIVKSNKKIADNTQSNFNHLKENELEDSMLNNFDLTNKSSLLNVADAQLEINTIAGNDSRSRVKGSPLFQVQLLRKSRYRKKILDPINQSKPKMSNNIKDYLSVQKISMRQAQDNALSNKMKMIKNFNHSNLLAYNNPQNEDKTHLQLYNSEVMIGPPPRHRPENILIRKSTKFKPPFPLYNYRDFMWKVAYSNQYIVETVEYESKVKYFVGPGNNSNLIKGIVRRRPWFLLIDKAQDAQFVWTQIKVPSIFQTQIKGETLLQSIQRKQQTKNSKPSKNFSLFNLKQNQRWGQYWGKSMDKQRGIKQNFKLRTKLFGLPEHPQSQLKKIKVHNHFANNFIIGNKKALFKTMSQYYSSKGQQVFHFLPLTFHIKSGLQDDEYLKFLQHFYSISKQNKANPQSINKFNAWIVKPGENTNRGNGIIVCLDLNQIKTILKSKEKHNDGTYKTYILQKYIERPLLYKRRKFDLRHYIMMNCVNGRMKGYWYHHGYVRTTSSQYTLKVSSGSIHLTNDAVQKYLPDYGKFQLGNKITYQQLNTFMKKNDPSFDFFQHVYPQMKKIATDAIHASAQNMDPLRKVNNFEVFGMDFMIDANYHVWLIQINTNPCLQTTCPVLAKIIPKFIQDTLQICIDPVFTAPLNFEPKYENYYKNVSEQNDFELVFDERIDSTSPKENGQQVQVEEQEDDVFDDDGQDFQG